MRIGIDARELCGHATGVGRYLAGLLAEWARSPRRGHDFVLYAPEALPPMVDVRQFTVRVLAGRSGTWWEQIVAPRAAARDGLDVWFAPAYSAPLTIAVPTVVAVHDVSFFARPDWFTLREGVRRRFLVRRSVARAAAVITISQFSKRELIERLDARPEHIHVIPPGVNTWTNDATATAESANASRRTSPRVLFVGSLFSRRRVPELIGAFAPIARAHADATLDLVGDNRTYPREDIGRVIASAGLDRQVRWHQYVTDDCLRDLYAAARAFAFLSEYEGLGLTPLEALAAGVPPVLLDTPVAREGCGEAALYVAPGDRAGVTRALEAALFDPDVRARILAAAPAVLARYHWPRAANETLGVIERAG